MNSTKVIDGIRWELARVLRLQLSNKAEERRKAAQEKLDARKAASADCTWDSFMSSLPPPAQSNLRAVCRYMHYVVHRADDKIALNLPKDPVTARLACVREHVPGMIADAGRMQPARNLQPVLKAQTLAWELLPFVPFQ